MKRTIIIILILFPLIARSAVSVRVKDLVYIDGLKHNQVFGYGLVVGLQGTGDTRIQVTRMSLRNVLKNLGLQQEDLERSRNVAAVLVTAELPEMVRVGDRVDVSVSSIGDARSIEGGVLIQSPLRGANGEIFVVAQGRISGSGDNDRESVRTGGLITNGGIVERNIETVYTDDARVTFVLHQWDFTVANEIVEEVQELYPQSQPQINQNGKIELQIPDEINFSVFIEEVFNIEVTPEYGPRVVINERDGVIVMGGDIRISEAVISRNGMKITVNGQERDVAAQHMPESATVADIVDALNQTGLSTSEIVSILKALRDAGALHAELIIK